MKKKISADFCKIIRNPTLSVTADLCNHHQNYNSMWRIAKNKTSWCFMLKNIYFCFSLCPCFYFIFYSWMSPGILALSALSTNRNLSGFYGFQIKIEKWSLINLGQTLLREFTDSIVYLHMLFARNHANQIKWPESYCWMWFAWQFQRFTETIQHCSTIAIQTYTLTL